MPDLDFQVLRAAVASYGVVPTLNFTLQVNNDNPNELVHSVILRCQIQIASTARHYGPDERGGLLDLFGEPERWGETLRSMLWTHASVTVPPFSGSTEVELPVACTFDFNVAATKYFAALEGGEVPLLFLFSGTVFYRGFHDMLQVAQISWSREAPFRLPVEIWQQMMEHYYPNSAWLSLNKDVFERLRRYRMRRGLASWEQTLESLLPPEENQELE